MKRYISLERVKVIFMDVCGEPYVVKFQDLGKMANRGVFVTNNVSVAEALEQHPDFGKYFFLESGTIDDAPAKKHVYLQEYPDVHRTQEANKILVTEYGIDKEKLNSKADALEAAERINIHFPNLV